mmetsp:Transcript_45645/g.118053  ORF Transcript_45645/g.118053 Transcript_45645/m.118053 type:complete len:242 (-) Transcript_45645:445-1170(-)
MSTISPISIGFSTSAVHSLRVRCSSRTASFDVCSLSSFASVRPLSISFFSLMPICLPRPFTALRSHCLCCTFFSACSRRRLKATWSSAGVKVPSMLMSTSLKSRSARSETIMRSTSSGTRSLRKSLYTSTLRMPSTNSSSESSPLASLSKDCQTLGERKNFVSSRSMTCSLNSAASCASATLCPFATRKPCSMRPRQTAPLWTCCTGGNISPFSKGGQNSRSTRAMPSMASMLLSKRFWMT